MSENTGIQWTDATWNPIRGCSRVSEGCRNCYAEAVATRFSGPGQPYEGLARRTSNGAPRWTGKILFVEKALDWPLRWRGSKQARAENRSSRIFVNSMSDLFHENAEDYQIARIFATMAASQHHTFQVLTKRPERMKALMSSESFRQEVEPFLDEIIFERTNPHDRRTDDLRATAPDILDNGWPLPNVWLGVSVENQAAADERIPLLLDTPAAIRFLSCEPLLGEVKLSQPWRDYLAGWNVREQHHRNCNSEEGCVSGCPEAEQYQTEKIDWVIVGGESGPNARPCDVQWVREIVDQCHASRAPVFVKQLGAYPVIDKYIVRYEDGHGGNPEEWSPDLRIREFPQVAA